MPLQLGKTGVLGVSGAQRMYPLCLVLWESLITATRIQSKIRDVWAVGLSFIQTREGLWEIQACSHSWSKLNFRKKYRQKLKIWKKKYSLRTTCDHVAFGKCICLKILVHMCISKKMRFFFFFLQTILLKLLGQHWRDFQKRKKLQLHRP